MSFRAEDITIRIVDMAERAREVFEDKANEIAGRELPEHEYRYEATAERDGRKVTVSFHLGARPSAEGMLAWINRGES